MRVIVFNFICLLRPFIDISLDNNGVGNDADEDTVVKYEKNGEKLSSLPSANTMTRLV